MLYYALSKRKREKRLSSLSFSTTSTFPLSSRKKRKTFSLSQQPSQTQAGTPHDPSRGGTIYLASTGPCTQNEPNVNMVAAWAMTNTSSLGSPGFGVVRKIGDSPAAPSSSWTIPSISKAALVEVPAYRDPGAFVSGRGRVSFRERGKGRKRERERVRESFFFSISNKLSHPPSSASTRNNKT